jgi:hypothetical protein
MQAYTKWAIQQRQDAKKSPYPQPPKGFDISLADAMSEFNLDEKQIKELGELTARREIANAQVGRNVYYRRATIERLFGNAK